MYRNRLGHLNVPLQLFSSIFQFSKEIFEITMLIFLHTDQWNNSIIA